MINDVMKDAESRMKGAIHALEEDLGTIRTGRASPALVEKPMIVVATKLDATTDRTHLDELRAFCAKRGLEFYAISSASGEGIPQLVRAMADALDRLGKPVAATAMPTADRADETSPSASNQPIREDGSTARHWEDR